MGKLKVQASLACTQLFLWRGQSYKASTIVNYISMYRQTYQKIAYIIDFRVVIYDRSCFIRLTIGNLKLDVRNIELKIMHISSFTLADHNFATQVGGQQCDQIGRFIEL